MADPTSVAANAWQERSGQAWARLAERTDLQLAELGELALDALAPRAGESVLDVGCGCGQTSIELGVRVGASGSVLGVDISEPMLTRAKERILQASARNVNVLLADAALHHFEPGAFDAVFSRFGVMFFDDAVAAFSNLRRALGARGRLGFVCWQALELNEWASVPLRAVRALAPAAELPALLSRDQPGPFSFADRERVMEILSAAGFLESNVRPHTALLQVGGASTVEEAVDYALEIGPAARFVAERERALTPQFREALSRAFEPYTTPAGVFMQGAVFVVSARA